MSTVTELLGKLRATEEARVMLERQIAQRGESFDLTLSLGSIEKRERDLQHELHEATRSDRVDLLSYRTFAAAGHAIKVTAVAGALLDFQYLFTTVVDAIKGGPRERKRVDAAVAEKTA